MLQILGLFFLYHGSNLLYLVSTCKFSLLGTPNFTCLLHGNKLFLSKTVGVLGQLLHVLLKDMYVSSGSIDLNDVTFSVKHSSAVSPTLV